MPKGKALSLSEVCNSWSSKFSGCNLEVFWMPKEMWHPIFCFHFLFILVFFSPGIFYSLHVASLRRSLQHVQPPLPREGAAFAAIFASSSLIPWPSLLSAFLSGHEMEPSLSSLPAVRMDLILFLDEDPGHSTSRVLLLCGHFKGPPFIKSHVFSKCVPMMATGYSESLGCPDPKCHQGRVRE